MLEWTAIDPLNGNKVSGQLAADGLGYVMIDDGPDYPYGAYVFNPGFGAAETSTATNTVAVAPPSPPTVTNKELFTALYTRNKSAFWIGGSVVGFLTLSGLFGIIRR